MGFLFLISRECVKDILQHVECKVVLDPGCGYESLSLRFLGLNLHVVLDLFEYVPFVQLEVLVLVIFFVDLCLFLLSRFEKALSEHTRPPLPELTLVHVSAHVFALFDEVCGGSCVPCIGLDILFVLFLD